MKKSDKKLDKQLSLLLTEVCEWAKEHINGFLWNTHFVNYARFQQSLRIVCVFDNDISAQQAKIEGRLSQYIIQVLQQHESNISVKPNQIHFDSEIACEIAHQGNWQKRYLKR